MLAASLAMHFALAAASAQPYDSAYQQAQANGQPLVVLVGADWCPGCRTMKHNVMARLERSGRLSNVSYTTINTDAQSDLAGQLMQGGMIPQLIVFSKQEDGRWRREQITGAASETQVSALIARAQRAQAVAKKAPSSGSSAVGN
jgi:thioredoxin-like negative regulator of GroEL